ncbi:Acetylglutamate kinase [Legionella steelei]|uniref:Acetylglutamate kinase n=1 Tax=Legionella steelei TaxID=947033 RepID=A0A0W0ZI34_9GAMM|nr:Acetylglutamate kinase [Legionella steelei]
MSDQVYQKFILSPNKPILIKVGGSVLHNEESTYSLCQELKAMSICGFKVVIVHGGSKAINEALNIYRIKSTFIQGLRQTTQEAMKIIEMVLCGQVNQHLVRNLNRLGVPAIGLSGSTNQTLVCDYVSEEHGFVGEIKKVNTTYLECLLNAKENFLPVIASLGVDELGNAMNINADLAASYLANALKVQKLIYFTDQEGIYDKQGNLLALLSEEHLDELVQKSIVKDGMLVKVKAILESLRQGLNRILIANGHQKNILTHALLSEKNVGTLCVKEY